MARRTKRPGARAKRRKEGSRKGFNLRGIRLPEVLDHRLDHAMEVTGMTRSTIVREALTAFLGKLERQRRIHLRTGPRPR